jgi:hypothetical protein
MALVELTAPSDQGTVPATTAAAAETSGTTPRLQVVVTSFVAILAFWAISIGINRSFKPTALVIPAGISIFAMLYAVTQGMERLLEPISSFFFSTKWHTQFRNATLAAAVNLQGASENDLPVRVSDLTNVIEAAEHRLGKRSLIPFGWFHHNPARKEVAAACTRVTVPPAGPAAPNHVAAATKAAKKAAVKLAAAAQADLDQRRADKTIAYWALASILGVLFSATLGLYLLHTVGLSSDGLSSNGSWTGSTWSPSGIRHMLDILVTGLALGGGTKPLHDLISNLQTTKNIKKDPGQTQ